LLETICRALEIERVTCYSFRHSWATIAQNDCGASTALVAFALNHATEYRITKGYIKTDFSPIDRLNEQVLEMIFDSNNK
jgi:integrase